MENKNTSWWNRLRLKLAGWFTPQENLKQTDAAKTEDQLRREAYEQLKKEREEQLLSIQKSITDFNDDHKLVEFIDSHIDRNSASCRALGELDGKIGTRDLSFYDNSEAYATYLTGQINSMLVGRIEGMKLSLASKNGDLLKKNGLHEQLQQTRDKIESSAYKHRSAALLWFYFLFGICMILADIVVSINLVNYFGIGNVMVDDDGNSDFVQKFLDPDLLFFSLGIAFCTVYVKILYDTYLGGEAGEGYRKFREAVNDGTHKNFYWAEWITVLLFKLLILFGLLALLYYLSEYRMIFTMNDDGSISKIINEKIGQKAPQISYVMLQCFRGITIIIPIIGGICLSLGFRILNNRKFLERLKEKIAVMGDEITLLKKELELLATRYHQFLRHHEEWKNSTEKIQLIARVYNSNYNQGFKRGFRHHFGNDLYSLVEERRNDFI